MKHDFEYQHSAQTLREGLAEYYLKNPALLRGETLSPPAREFFRRHDAAHVVFGCGTDLRHEAVVKLSSMFGTTAGLGVLAGYRLHEAFDIYRELRLGDMAKTIAAAVVIVPRTVLRCLRQRQRWPWDDFAAEMDAPLCDIRARYGITVARRCR